MMKREKIIGKAQLLQKMLDFFYLPISKSSTKMVGNLGFGTQSDNFSSNLFEHRRIFLECFSFFALHALLANQFLFRCARYFIFCFLFMPRFLSQALREVYFGVKSSNLRWVACLK